MGNTNTKPFGVKDKIGYMCGDIANDFTFIFASSYVMVFYTKVMGVSAGMVGTMFLLARCLDAFTDIGMGRIVDNSKPTKNGRIRPWILRMCAFVALASFMMYQSFLVDAPYAAKVAYMFITYILWGSIFYTFHMDPWHLLFPASRRTEAPYLCSVLWAVRWQVS